MDRELLFSVTKADLDITWHCTPGRKKNVMWDTCRILHRDSGARTSASSRRKRTENLKAAFRALVDHPKFRTWWRKRIHEILSGETLDDVVARPKNLKLEVLRDGAWSVTDLE